MNATGMARTSQPSPYHVQEVTFRNMQSNITLAGTVTWPEETNSGPAVVLIPGGGSHDRDYSVGRHRPFYVLADCLTRHGIAVLRFDECGVGSSEGDPRISTCENYADDVLAGVRFLEAFKEFTPNRVGLIGHSEGGMVASIAAAKYQPISLLILLATPGLPGDEYQIQYEGNTGRAMGLSEEAIASRRAVQEEVFAVLLTEQDHTQAESQIRSIYRSHYPGIPDEKIDAGARRFLSPGFRYNLAYDPVRALSRVQCPVLAIYGEKDLHVTPDGNASRMKEILRSRPGAPAYEVLILPGLNHFFQPNTPAAPFAYDKNTVPISPVVLDKISTWIHKHKSKN